MAAHGEAADDDDLPLGASAETAAAAPSAPCGSGDIPHYQWQIPLSTSRSLTKLAIRAGGVLALAALPPQLRAAAAM